MDIVAARGLLAETCLLKLSTASRDTVTQAERHKAKKFLMNVRAVGRAVVTQARDRNNLFIKYRNDRQMMQRALANIAVNDHLTDPEQTAGVALQLSVGRTLSIREVIMWSADHVWHLHNGFFAAADGVFTINTGDTSEEESEDEEQALEDPHFAQVVR
mgnify:FL=1